MDYLELTNEILPQVGSVPPPSILRAVRNAAIQFAKETQILSVTHVDQVVTDDQVTLVAADPSEEAPYLVNTVEYRGTPLAFTYDGPDITLLDSVSDNEVVTVEAVHVPSRASTSCDDRIMETHFETIVAGAVAKLLNMSTAPWFNPNMAAQAAIGFAAGVEKAIAHRRNDDREGIKYMGYGGL